MTIDQLPTLTDPTGAVYFPVNKNGADYKLPTGGVAFHTFTADSVGTTLTFATNSRALLVVSGSGVGDKGAYIINATSVTASAVTVLAGSNITISPSNKQITVSDSVRTVTCLLVMFDGIVTIQ